MTTPVSFDVRVKFSAGTHTTNPVNGQRASSTMGASHAVQKLGHKLVTDRPFTAHRIGQDWSAGVEAWRIEA